MRLLSLYVKSFGKLRDFSYEFTEGFNEIKEDNGFGKTTLAAFIKAMFYGYANNKKTDIFRGVALRIYLFFCCICK